MTDINIYMMPSKLIKRTTKKSITVTEKKSSVRVKRKGIFMNIIYTLFEIIYTC